MMCQHNHIIIPSILEYLTKWLLIGQLKDKKHSIKLMGTGLLKELERMISQEIRLLKMMNKIIHLIVNIILEILQNKIMYFIIQKK